jgi:hypothetical protein
MWMGDDEPLASSTMQEVREDGLNPEIITLPIFPISLR